MATIIGRASGENHADNPSSTPRAAPTAIPRTGLFIDTALKVYSTRAMIDPVGVIGNPAYATYKAHRRR
jgi:hypothetical protein